MKDLIITPQPIKKCVTLRGGGCAASTDKNKQKSDPAIKKIIQLPEDFSESIKSNTEVIVQKSLVINDQQNQSDVLISIQWFICMEENFILISCNEQLATLFIDLIQDSFINLLEVCLKYIRAAGIICLFILRILSQLSKVIFYFYMKNEKRFMKEDQKQNLISQLLELEQQMEIEGSNIWVTGIEFEIEIIKACLKNLPSDSKQGRELLITFFGSAIKSVATMSLDDALIDTLIQGTAFLIDKYQTHNLKQLYQLYYSLDLIKWSLIQQLQKGAVVTDIIHQLSKAFQKYILNSTDWMIHYCWIRVLGDLIQYRPTVQKEQIQEVNQNTQQIWNKLIEFKIINPLAFNKQNYAKIAFFNDSPNYSEHFAPIRKIFKGLEELKKLQLYLTSSRNQDMNFFHTYVFPKIQIIQNNNIEKTKLIQLRNFIFLDKSIEYISNLNNILQQQMSMFQTNLPALLQKLTDFNSFLINSDFNMIEIQIENLIESLQQLINQSQSLQLLIMLIFQYLNFYRSKQLQIEQALDSLKQKSEKETKFIGQMKASLKRLLQNCNQSTETIEKFISQQFYIQQKLKDALQIIMKVSQNQKLTDEDKQILLKINLINQMNETILIGSILLECQQVLLQLNKQLTETHLYQHTIYEDSKNISPQTFQQLDLPIGRLQLEYFLNQTDIKFLGNQILKVEARLNQLKLLTPSMDSFSVENSEFNLISQLLSCFGEVLQFQLDFWNRIQEYLQNSKNDMLSKSQEHRLEQNNLLGKFKQNFKITLESSLNYFENIDKQQDDQIQQSSIQETTDQEQDNLMKQFLGLKQNISQVDDIQYFQQIMNDIEVVLKIMQTKNYLKIQLKTEYISILQNLKTSYEFFEEKSQKVIEQNQDQQIEEEQVRDENIETIILDIVASIIIDINSAITELQNINLAEKEIYQTIIDSHQAAQDIQQEQISTKIILNLQTLITEKISNFQLQFQQFVTQIQCCQEQVSKLNNYKSSNFPKSQNHEEFELLQQENFIEQAKLFVSKIQNEQQNKKSLLGQAFQEIKDKWNNQGHKLREVIAVTCVFLSSNLQEVQVQKFCQDTLISIWSYEKDERVKKILKNKDILAMQVKVFSSNLKGVNEKIKDEIQSKFQELEKLEQALKQEGDPQKREELKKKLNEEFQLFEEYVDNMNEMNSELRLSIEFLKTISKQIKRMEEKIDQLQATLNDVGLDLKFLRGKRYDQLLQIRKSQVLQNKNIIDQKSVYVKLQTIEKDVLTGQYLDESEFFVEDITNETAELNEFLWAKKDINKEVMLIHGCAGSGKSTAARKIEEFLWLISDSTNKNLIKYIPIYVSLPTVKEPEQNVVEQTLESEAYHFDAIQLRELKEATLRNEFRLVLILDSYDEIKPKFITKNLYKSNRLKEVWGNPKVIFTTRTEILTSNHYSLWFCGNDLSSLKEIEIQRFNFQQRNRYLEQFCEMTVKMHIIELYKFYLQIENKKFHDMEKFISIWSPIEVYLKQISNQENTLYLTHQQVLQIVELLKKNDFLNRLNKEQFKNFEKELQGLWGKKKFDDTITNIHIEKLLETPFMMEIVVQVLPIMTKKYSDYIKQKDVFIHHFSQIKEQQLKEIELIQKYRPNQQSEIEENDISLIQEYAASVWENLEIGHFFSNFSISNKITREMLLQIDNQIQDSDLIISTLKRHNLTQYDFYQSFAEFYHNCQIQKLRDQGKMINYESILLDLNQFSMSLAFEMTKNQLTQVQYKFSGQLQLTTNHNKSQQKWEDEFFNDLGQNGEYKKLIRSAVILGQKGSIYFFVHKSIQEFFIAKYIYELLERSHSLNLNLLSTCIELGQQINSKLQFPSFLEQNFVLITTELKRMFEIDIQLQKKTQKLEKDLTDIIAYLKWLQLDYINEINISKEEFHGSIKFLKEKINLDNQAKLMMLHTSKLSGIDSQFIRLSSNFFYLLTIMYEYLGEQDFRQVILQDTSIAGGLFHGSDFSGSVLKNVNISGINLNRAILANVEWSNLRINELPSSLGHEDQITCMDFSPVGTQIVSSSMDLTIKLWDANSGKHIKDFVGHSDWVLSVAFSPDATQIVSCGCDKSIIIWSVETASMNKKLLGDLLTIKKVLFSPDGLNILSGGDEKNLKLWQIQSQTVIKKFEGHLETINSFCFSKKGLDIVSCSQDGKIIIWDTQTAESKKVIDKHAFSVCFSPDTQKIVSGGHNQIIYIWNAISGEQLFQISGHFNTVLCVTYSKDGTRIASGSTDKTIRLWDATTTKEMQRLEGHQEFVNQVLFSSNGQKLISCSKDKTIRQWDITGKETIKMEGHSGAINSLQFSPDALSLLSGSFSDTIGVWNAQNGKSQIRIKESKNEAKIVLSPNGQLIASRNKTNIVIRNLKNGEIENTIQINDGLPTSISFSPDSQKIATSNISNLIVEWNVKTGEIIKHKLCKQIPYSITYNNEGDYLAVALKYGTIELLQTKPVEFISESLYFPESYSTGLDEKNKNNKDAIAVAFSPDDQSLIAGYQNSLILIWNVKDKSNQMIKVHSDAVNQVAFSLDGRYIISASDDYTISIVDVSTLNQISKLEGHQSEIISLALSLDGQRFAAGGWDKTISLWSYTKSPTYIRHQKKDWPVFCSEEQRILASGSYDYKVRLWNLNTGQEMIKLIGHQNKIISVTISSDYQKVAACNINNLIIIWNAQNGAEIWRYQENQQLNSIISFSNNGNNLIVGGIDDLIIIYDIEQKLKLYSNYVGTMLYLQMQSQLKNGWLINDDNNQIQIINQKTKDILSLPKEQLIKSDQLTISCYKVISEYLTSLKSKDAYIYNSKISNQLGFDIKILLEQRGGFMRNDQQIE